MENLDLLDLVEIAAKANSTLGRKATRDAVMAAARCKPQGVIPCNIKSLATGTVVYIWDNNQNRPVRCTVQWHTASDYYMRSKYRKIFYKLFIDKYPIDSSGYVYHTDNIVFIVKVVK